VIVEFVGTCRLRCFFAALIYVSFTSAGFADLYVSTKGNDEADGSRSSPFASLETAVRRVRESRTRRGKNEPETIWIGDGAYALKQPVNLEGAKDSHITIRAAHPGKVLLDVSVVIDEKRFKQSNDQRLDPSAVGKVFECDLKSFGLKHVKKFPNRFPDTGGLFQVFSDETWQPMSRWPNDRNAKMKKVLDRGDNPGSPGKRPGKFVFEGDRPARWQRAAEAGQLWLAGFWRVAWDWQSVRVDKIDLEENSILLASPIFLGIGSKYAGPEGAGTEPWRAINLVEEIDMPGEWAFDFIQQKLFFWPPSNLSRVRLADREDPLFRLVDTNRVTLEGLNLQGSLGNAIEIEGGANCAVRGCRLSLCGKNGVVIRGGIAHRVESCDLTQLGHGGILLGGGDRATLTRCDHVAENNHIHHYALGKKIWSPGIGVGANDAGYACGCIVRHNLVHDSPHAAILYGGNDHLFEFNEIHDFLIESDDLGGLYTNNGWLSYGNVLRHNFIHHTSHALGVYLDDADSGDTVEGNFMFKMGTGAAIGGGHDNVLRANLAIDCPGGFGIDSRGVGRKYNEDKNILKDLASVDLQSGVWHDRYPQLATLMQDKPELPLRCVLESNVVIGTDKSSEKRGKKEHFEVVTFRDNLRVELSDLSVKTNIDKTWPLVMDEHAPVYQKVRGFEPIPFQRIGLQVDSFRQKIERPISGHSKSEWHNR
jgi:hypothetical protein